MIQSYECCILVDFIYKFFSFFSARVFDVFSILTSISKYICFFLRFRFINLSKSFKRFFIELDCVVDTRKCKTFRSSSFKLTYLKITTTSSRLNISICYKISSICFILFFLTFNTFFQCDVFYCQRNVFFNNRIVLKKFIFRKILDNVRSKMYFVVDLIWSFNLIFLLKFFECNSILYVIFHSKK